MISLLLCDVGSDRYGAMLSLRRRLLRAPLGLDFTETELAAERHQIHLALCQNGEVIGTLLVVPPGTDRTGKLRQMAVEPSHQRLGHGSALVRAGEEQLRRLDAVSVVLAARATATSFYEKLGYERRGEPFVEVTIQHCRMLKSLIREEGDRVSRPPCNL